jgi:oligopeptide/dipeptide ABC transporter ATP-binding protein
VSRVVASRRDRAAGRPTGAQGPARPAGASGGPVLSVADLSVEYPSAAGPLQAVSMFTMAMRPGQVVGIAGESGSGKTAVALALMGLSPSGAVVSGSIRLGEQEMVGRSEKEWRRTRGHVASMVFQETQAALNPTVPIGIQVSAVFSSSLGLPRSEARAETVEALRRVQLTDVDRVMRSYPHQLSGGMCQRVVIAMAVSCGSRILIADEPTTALDVRVQQDILHLIRRFAETEGLAVVLISHDLAVLEDMCNELIIMYRGEIAETGPTADVLASPQHPYTRQLLACSPRLGTTARRLAEIPRADRAWPAGGCLYRSRCDVAFEKCGEHPPLPVAAGPDPHRARCWRAISEPAA